MIDCCKPQRRNCTETAEACTVEAYCCIADPSDVHSRATLQLRTPQVPIHRDLPVTFGILPDVLNRCDVLQELCGAESATPGPGNVSRH